MHARRRGSAPGEGQTHPLQRLCGGVSSVVGGTRRRRQQRRRRRRRQRRSLCADSSIGLSHRNTTAAAAAAGECAWRRETVEHHRSAGGGEVSRRRHCRCGAHCADTLYDRLRIAFRGYTRMDALAVHRRLYRGSPWGKSPDSRQKVPPVRGKPVSITPHHGLEALLVSGRAGATLAGVRRASKLCDQPCSCSACWAAAWPTQRSLLLCHQHHFFC
jgi:hypothetical protein